MLVRFMSCRERFRLKYVLGLEPMDKWNKTFGYGNMWHVCEEAHASENLDWSDNLLEYTKHLINKYRAQAEEIEKWFNVCRVQFPEYIKYWKEHPDVKNRTPLMQEQVFDVLHTLPSGRKVRLRGKSDSVDLIKDDCGGFGEGQCKLCGSETDLDGVCRATKSGIYLQENKTKGDIDKLQVERQLKFDLQTMLYLIALSEMKHLVPEMEWVTTQGHIPVVHEQDGKRKCTAHPIKGVRYNVVRRPLSGGVGSIRPHAAKATKTKITPAETAEQFYERLRADYIAADPAYWFFRVRSEVLPREIQEFQDTCLNPLLEQVCCWYEQTTDRWDDSDNCDYTIVPQMNYRTPFGVYSALEEGGATEYDAYLATGSEAGLRRVEEMFTELQ